MFQRKRKPSAQRPNSTQLDMTSMVDVTFLLLIFFMVTASFALQNVFNVPVPGESGDVGSQLLEERQPITVTVDEFNTYTVATEEWEREAPSKQDLYIQLRRAVDERRTRKLLVRASRECLHEKVVAVMDAGSHFQMDELQLQTVD